MKLAISLCLGVILLLPLLSTFESHLHENTLPEQSPIQSARNQVEFESGQLLQEVRQAEDRNINTYSWADADHHYVRVPIDRAIEVLLDKDSLEPRDVFNDGMKEAP